jgi:NADP-dependent 3-hydroxy acid dehydrogenase YdfG
LGLAIATRFAAAGHPVIMLARSADRLTEFEQKIWAARRMSATNNR